MDHSENEDITIMKKNDKRDEADMARVSEAEGDVLGAEAPSDLLLGFDA